MWPVGAVRAEPLSAGGARVPWLRDQGALAVVRGCRVVKVARLCPTCSRELRAFPSHEIMT